MHLDARDSLNLSLNRVYEPFETEILQRLVQPGDTVLDVGANIGYYTLIFARRVGAAGRVIAFEPDPDNFALLRRNIQCNGYQNVTLVNAALSNQNGTVKLYLCDENRGDHRLYPSADRRRAIEVQALTADEFCQPFAERLTFVKMDVQGAEGRVLQGMTEVLRRTAQCQLIFEFWPLGLQSAGDDPCEVLALLGRLGFEFHLLDEQRKELRKVAPERLLEEFSVGNGHQTNLLATPVVGKASADATGC
jgi:FkbM family methyltransferase